MIKIAIQQEGEIGSIEIDGDVVDFLGKINIEKHLLITSVNLVTGEKSGSTDKSIGGNKS